MNGSKEEIRLMSGTARPEWTGTDLQRSAVKISSSLILFVPRRRPPKRINLNTKPPSHFLERLHISYKFLPTIFAIYSIRSSKQIGSTLKGFLISQILLPRLSPEPDTCVADISNHCTATPPQPAVVPLCEIYYYLAPLPGCHCAVVCWTDTR